jgi:hypothetical protein
MHAPGEPDDADHNIATWLEDLVSFADQLTLSGAWSTESVAPLIKVVSRYVQNEDGFSGPEWPSDDPWFLDDGENEGSFEGSAVWLQRRGIERDTAISCLRAMNRTFANLAMACDRVRTELGGPETPLVSTVDVEPL